MTIQERFQKILELLISGRGNEARKMAEELSKEMNEENKKR